jgi:hypothetical protein
MPKKLSDHFTLEEMTISQTAVRKGIDNTPSPEETKNLKALCVSVLDPLRAMTENPIVVSSGYRSPKLNKAVGGAKSSQHVRGEAADITCPAIGQKKLFDLIRKSELPFDQVIDEFERWVHVSFSRDPAKNRREVLRARKVNGKTVYTKV